jgi:hypothetical protein
LRYAVEQPVAFFVGDDAQKAHLRLAVDAIGQLGK